MLATLVSIVFVLIFTFVYQFSILGFFPIIALTIGGVVLLMTPFIKGLSLLPLQAASVETSSRCMNLGRNDLPQLGLLLTWVSFSIFSFFVSAYDNERLFIAWIIWLGVSLDAMFLYVWRATGFADPFYLIRYHLRKGKRNFSSEQQKELAEHIEALAEISLKGAFQKSLSLSIQGVVANENLAKSYLSVMKGDQREDAAERVQYTLGFLLHRLQMLFNQAAEDRLEPLANQIIISLSKITVAVAEFNTSQLSLPLHFLDSFLQTSREFELKEVCINSTIVLKEVAKSLIETPELRDENLPGALFMLIQNMEEIAKETFKENKNTPILLLTEPFEDLKKLLEEKIPQFPKSKEVINDLGRVIAEFQALQSVLQSIPNIPGYSDAESKENDSKEPEDLV